MQVDDNPVVQVVEFNQQMLFDKIVNLQKSLAHKCEKVDFLEDHVARLVHDISRKNRHVCLLVYLCCLFTAVVNCIRPLSDTVPFRSGSSFGAFVYIGNDGCMFCGCF